jgi:hypothetical protein
VAAPGVREAMAALTGGRRGIPVIRLGGEVAVGFDRHWLRTRLALA